MDAAILVLLVAVIGWILAHNSQCARMHERVVRLETRMGIKHDDPG